MTKSMVLPIIAVVALGVKALTGIEISADLQEQLATGIVILGGVAYAIYGVFKNHKKEGEK